MAHPAQIALNASSDPTSNTAAENALTQVSPEMRRLRVLVVDDVAMNRDIAGSFLRSAGHEVTCVDDGAEAVQVAASADFDVVLMDVRMPGMDGLEASRRIRAVAGPRGQVPIVALTAQVFTEQVEECRRAGMNSHLPKPFTLDTLRAAVLDAAARSTVDRERDGADDISAAACESDPDMDTPVTSVPVVVGSEFPVLDRAAFEHTAAFLAPEAVTSYLQTIAGRGETLLRRLRARDALAGAGDLVDAAHALAGSAGMFGFERLATVARNFEHAVLSGAPNLQAFADGLAAAIQASLLAMPSRVSDLAATASTTDNGGATGDLVTLAGA